MEKTQLYPKIDGIPTEPGLYFVDDEEYGELSVTHVYFDSIQQDLCARMLGFEDDLGSASLKFFTFYGPIPTPSNAMYKLFMRDDDDE